VVEEYLVMTVRAHAWRDLALILRTAWSEAENHHHQVIEAHAPRVTAHPLQVIAGDISEHYQRGQLRVRPAGEHYFA
jgi:hypothetical protein